MTETLLTRLANWTEAEPDAHLFSFLDERGRERERLDYAGFSRRVDALASHMAALPGTGSGDRVVIACPPGLDAVASLYAAARAGLIGVPAPAFGAHRLDAARHRVLHIVRDCGARALVSDAAGLRRLCAGAACLARLPALAVDEVADAGHLPDRRVQEIFFIQYTSGSTSDPKGVMVSHANLLANCAQVVDHDRPVTVSWLPQHHDMGLIGCYLFIASSGGSTCGMSTTTFVQRPMLWLTTLSEQRATATSAPNFAFELCLRRGRLAEETFATLDLSSVRFMTAAAEPVTPDIYRRFLNRFQPAGLRPEAFFVAYGLAENTLAVTNYGRRSLSVNLRGLAAGEARRTESASGIARAGQMMSCGVPLPGTELRIVDPASRREAGPGEAGEVWVRGPAKCGGYWGRPKQSAETFEARLAGAPADAPGFLRTGDMGFLDDGELVICGRYKDLIILRGQNYYPQDIEATVEGAAPQLRPGCVAAFALDEDSRVAVVAELFRRCEPPEAERIFGAVRDRLGIGLDLLAFVPPRSLPKTTSGKLMRFRAREMLAEGAFELLAQHCRPRLADGEDSDAAALPPFEGLRRRYGLSGTDTRRLVDVGVDSLELVTLVHEVKERLGDRGARQLADQIDIRLIQGLSVAELFRVAALFDEAPEHAVAEIRGLVQRLRTAQSAAEARRMREDRQLGFDLPARTEVAPERRRHILLSGGTGFLGAFLVRSLLAQTDARLSVLVRAGSAEAGRQRLLDALRASGADDAETLAAFAKRTEAVPSDLEKPGLGLPAAAWDRLAAEVDTIYHNGALVNYLFTYDRMRAANVLGTREMLRLAAAGRPKSFNHVSTTFIFGWATRDLLRETDCNDTMEHLNFGYSQSKWVSEQIVLDGSRKGLPTRIFRPALITPSVDGRGSNFDIAMRLLAFMLKHGIGVDTMNQVSLVPVDVTANNIVAIAELPQTRNRVFHVTRDDYANMIDVANILAAQTGRRFEVFSLQDFVPEVIRRCRPDDMLFPLLDFLIGSIEEIALMEFKRYDSSAYAAARNASARGMPDPSLEETVAGIVSFLRRQDIAI